ncbi:MAG: transposase [Burkholderia sp.]
MPSSTRSQSGFINRLTLHDRGDNYLDARRCKPENKVLLDFVEGPNNKIRVIQRRAYGLRDEKYLRLRLKILTCMLPKI